MGPNITKLTVEKLFGRYDYEICFERGEFSEAPRASLLYGDNGSGKTTILELIFNLLSLHLGERPKSIVAKTPFQSFCLDFTDQSRILASRSGDNLTGAFQFLMELGEGPSLRISTEIEPNTKQGAPSPSSQIDEFLRKGALELDLDVYYLDDKRQLRSNARFLEREMKQPRRHSRIFRAEDYRGNSEGGSNDQGSSTLQETIFRTERWLKLEALRVSSIGDRDARQSFTEILRTIASASAPVGVEEWHRLREDLKNLESMSMEFAEFKLNSVIDAGALSEIIDNADQTTLPAVSQVLGPFLKGQRAKLDAVRKIYEKMRRFVDIVNEYLNDKNVVFDVFDGLAIRLEEGDLEPDLLSSGERNLLLLFLNVFAIGNRSSLFIIDEPELSLNIKWQRGLIDSLLDLGQETESQFLLATHSIELLAKHWEYVVTLDPHGQ